MIIRYEVNAPDVISEVLDGETIVLNFDTGRYYSLNPAATEVWRAIVSRSNATTTASPDVDAANPARLASFLQDLADEGLIRPCVAGDVDPGLAVSPSPAAEPCAFDSDQPRFERYDDLENLLLLDPIHDVSGAGWPHESDDSEHSAATLRTQREERE